MIALGIRFLYIGLFSFGGGFSAISLIRSEIVERLGWLTEDALTDLMAIAEMTPGPIAVNAASFTGMALYGLPGAVLATCACILPGCLISLAISRASQRLLENSRWQSMMKTLRAAVVGTMVAGGLAILKNALFPGGCPDYFALACFCLGSLAYHHRKLSPMAFMVAVSVFCGAFHLAAMQLSR